MSNVVNSAFTTIRAAAGLTKQSTPLKDDDKESLSVTEIEILPCLNPWIKWYRHPIYWWKWRHFRRDVKVMEEAVDPEFKKKVDEELEQRVFFGDGGVKEEDVDYDTYH